MATQQRTGMDEIKNQIKENEMKTWIPPLTIDVGKAYESFSGYATRGGTAKEEELYEEIGRLRATLYHFRNTIDAVNLYYCKLEKEQEKE